jgi:1,2-diacylglycerol 3-beta-glucosyltransferase
VSLALIALPLAVVMCALLLLTAYLLVLTAAAIVAPRRTPNAHATLRRFAILVPAHNEELLIGRLVANLRRLDYPGTHYDVHVVADNCIDRTAEIAESCGAIAHRRVDAGARAKGFALRWLIQRLQTESGPYDAYVVFDADSVVESNFLQAMNTRLAAGSQVVQAYYSVLNAADSPLSGIRFAALAALHYVRPLGRSVFGLSCGLKGNGMCFTAQILERFGWEWFTLAEDVEFHLELVRAGVRVDFAPETSVLADMPITFAQAASQNERWERGRLQMLRGRCADLLLDGIRRGSWLRIDAAIEQLVPPLSVPFAMGSALAVMCMILDFPLLTWLAVSALTGQAVYLLVSLRLVRAPLHAYLTLSYAPIYICWKLGVYARSIVSARAGGWVRTARSAV